MLLGVAQPLPPVLEPPTKERHGTVAAGPEEGREDNERVGAPALGGQAESWGSSAWGREGSRETLQQPSEGGLQESWGGTF